MAEEKRRPQKIKEYFLGSETGRPFLLLIYASIVTALLYNNGLPGIYLLFLAFLTLSKRTEVKFKQSFKNPFVYLSILFFGIQIVGMLYTSNMQEGWMKIENKLPFLVLPLFLFSISTKFWKQNKWRIFNFYILTTIVTTFILYGRALFMIISTGNLQKTTPEGIKGSYYFVYTELSSLVSHPGYLSLYIGVAIFLLTYKLFVAYKKSIWLWISYLIVFMFLLMGRGSFLAFAIVAGIGLLIYIFRQRNYKLSLLVLIPIVTAAVFIKIAPEKLSKRLTELGTISYDITAPTKSDFNGVTIRLAEWECATAAIKDYWLWGTGTGDVQDVLNEYYKKMGFIVGIEHRFNCHNQLLQTQLTSGVLGSVILLSLFVYLSIRSFRNKNYLLLAITWLLFLGMLTEATLERQMGIYVLLFFGSFLQLSFIDKKQAVKKSEEHNSGLPF